jgi:hypothetical protein
MLASCFASHEAVFRSAFDSLRPGGWFEMQDFAFPFRCIDDSAVGSAFERWSVTVGQALRALSRDWSRGPHYKAYFERVGFVDVVEKQFAWPIGAWPRDSKMKMLGAWGRQDVLEGLQAWSMAILTRGLGMTSAEVELMLLEARNDINSKRLHAYVAM